MHPADVGRLTLHDLAMCVELVAEHRRRAEEQRQAAQQHPGRR
ncbi:hypothetical protein [Amycolatopsis suaedae]|nr:hypothetical protein [Amycolatopsis suaedae]